MKGIISLLKGKSFISLLGNGISALLGLLSFAILARYTSKQDFGIWIIFLTTYGIFDTLRTGMILNAFIKNYTQSNGIDEEQNVIGSSWYLSLIVNALYFLIISIIYLIFNIFSILPQYHFFFLWYFLISIFSLPLNFSTWYLNAKLQILEMSLVRIFSQFLFVIFILFLFEFTIFDKLTIVLFCYTLSQLLTSIFCFFKGWTGLSYFGKRTKQGLNSLFNFGKFSMGTLLFSNLIKGSDSFIISKFLGTIAVATYSVPLRIVDFFEIIVRSFAITNMPLMSALHAKNDIQLLRKEFERKTGFLFFLLLPASIFCIVFAKQIVVLLAGAQYKDSYYLLQLFAIYTAFTPLDKLSGVMLDIINKPQSNFIKVILMLTVNVVGDIFSLYYFGTLESVAIVSTLTFLTGVFYGMYILNKSIEVNFLNIFNLGFGEFVLKFKTITQNKI